LSIKRAQSAVNYLVKNGDVEAFRINAKGYGEGSPAVKCGSDCTEEEYARNRRSEIKILGIATNIPYKSLEKIKYEENFDKMILALQDEGQVKVPEDGQLPPQITNEAPDEEDIMEKAVEEKMIEKVEEKVESEKVMVEKAVENMESEKAMIENVEEKISQQDMPETEVIKEAAVEKVMESKPVAETKVVKPVKETVAVSDVMEKEVAVQKVNTDTSTTSTKMAGDLSTYTGHKIVVAFRRTALDSGDARRSSGFKSES